jgi:hypothetical protein
MFDNTYYLQLKGTAMGTKMAPTYANLVLGYLEIKLYQTLNNMHEREIYLFVEKGWKRFLDDGYITWDKIH